MKNYLKTAIGKSIVTGLAMVACSTVQAQVFYGSPGVIQGEIIQQSSPLPPGAIVQQEEILQAPSEEELKQLRIGVSLYDSGSSPAIRSVFTNSPAQKVGLQSGDLIVKINGENSTTVSEFKSKLASMASGDSLKLTYSRDGEEKEATVSLTTLGDIVQASIVPEAGAYDSAISQSEMRISSTKQQIKNTQQDLEDLKKSLADQEKDLTELKAKAEAADREAEAKKAADAAKKAEEEAAAKAKAAKEKEAGSGSK